MLKIKINDKEFKDKEEAIKYINDLNEAMVVRIFAYPDLTEGRHGPLLKDEYYFKAINTEGLFDVREDSEPVIAELRNALIKIFGAEYDFVMGSKANPIKLWDVKVDYKISDKENLQPLDIDKLVKEVRDSFKDRLY